MCPLKTEKGQTCEECRAVSENTSLRLLNTISSKFHKAAIKAAFISLYLHVFKMWIKYFQLGPEVPNKDVALSSEMQLQPMLQ